MDVRKCNAEDDQLFSRPTERHADSGQEKDGDEHLQREQQQKQQQQHQDSDQIQENDKRHGKDRLPTLSHSKKRRSTTRITKRLEHVVKTLMAKAVHATCVRK